MAAPAAAARTARRAAQAAFPAEALPPIHWFPGHMAKGLKDMEQRLRDVDIVVEVRDARVRSLARPVAPTANDAARLTRLPRA